MCRQTSLACLGLFYLRIEIFKAQRDKEMAGESDVELQAEEVRAVDPQLLRFFNMVEIEPRRAQNQSVEGLALAVAGRCDSRRIPSDPLRRRERCVVDLWPCQFVRCFPNCSATSVLCTVVVPVLAAWSARSHCIAWLPIGRSH